MADKKSGKTSSNQVKGQKTDERTAKRAREIARQGLVIEYADGRVFRKHDMD
jgi:hypothetical protein